MAHFAQMDDATVLRVIVVHNNDAPDEALGIAFCKSLFGAETEWLQCSYNANIRKHYPGDGFTYEANADAFIPPQPYPSWLLNELTYLWESPVPYPADGKLYSWDETTKTWVTDNA